MNEIQKTEKQGQALTVAAPVQVGFNFFDPVQFETMQRVCRMPIRNLCRICTR